MDNSVYIILSRQMALFRDFDNTANNMANANTVGFNANRTLFTSYLVQDGPRGKMAFDQDIATYRDTSGGTLRTTGNTFDLAINGEGYFVLDTPLGTRYTRAGNLQVDGAGVLTSAEGYPVMDAGGQQIAFTEEDKNI